MNGTSIIILNYNTCEYIKMCIDSIRRYTQDEPYEIIVVDNGSKDSSVLWLKAQTDIRCIFNEKNEGFPKGCNQGLEIASGSELLLLNSDTIVTPHWLKNMKLALYSRPEVGAVGCMTNFCSNFQEVKAPYKGIDELFTFAEGFNQSNPRLWERRLRLVGFCYLFKRGVFNKIGYLDERFSPGNYEDDDYSFRIWQAGYELLLCKDTFIHHFGSGSFVRALSPEEEKQKREKYQKLLKRNANLFLQKWKVPWNYMELGLKDVFPEWGGPEVVTCRDILKKSNSNVAPGHMPPKIAHDLPVLYFSSEIKDVEQDDLEKVYFADEEAGEILGETGIEGLRLDFKAGVRIRIPAGNWHIRIGDSETGLFYFDQDVSSHVLISMEKYCIPWHIEVCRDGEFVFVHDFNPDGQEVFFDLSMVPMGTGIMLLAYIRAFQRENSCRVICRANPQFAELIRTYCPDLVLQEGMSEDTYAVFYPEAFQSEPYFCPDNCKKLSAEYIGRSILHLTDTPEPVHFAAATEGLKIEEPYVCIAVQASGIQKCWHYLGGWDEVIAYLKTQGYRVLCIDCDKVCEKDGYRVEMPDGAEDFTENRSLLERINLLTKASFFIGVSSGLSWLAMASGCPVVMISGQTLPQTEFDTPYRVINYRVCHGCYNDMRVDWQKKLCPYHGGTKRELECSKKITPQQVLLTIERLQRDLAKAEE